jgi:MFS family permease
LVPATQTLVRGHFNGKARARMYALLGATAGLAAALGPLIGGALTTYLSWRWAFAGETLVVVWVLLSRKKIPDVALGKERPHLDLVGGALSILGLGALVVGTLVLQTRIGVGVSLMVLGVAVLGGFIAWIRHAEAAGREPLVSPTLLVNRGFRGGLYLTTTQQFVLGCYAFIVPVFVQLVLGYTPMQAGLTVLPASFALLGVSIAVGKFASSISPMILVRFGLASASIGLIVILVRLGSAVRGVELALGLAFVGAGIGLLVSQLNNITLSSVDAERASEASGVNASFQNLGVSLGTAVAGTVLVLALTAGFSNQVANSSVFTDQQKVTAQAALDEGVSVVSNDAVLARLAGQDQAILDEAVRINTAVRPQAMQIALAVPITALLAALLITSRRRTPSPAA